MVKLIRQGVYAMEGRILRESQAFMTSDKKRNAVKNTITYAILKAHGAGEGDLSLRFDALVSPDSAYAGIVRAAEAGGMTSFPVPFTLADRRACGGGTACADGHAFGLSAAKKYGGDYLPAQLADPHQYMRECVVRGGDAVLGSDPHTRYGALGALGVAEEGGELVKQLLGRTYDRPRPSVIAVYLRGKLRRGVGPQDVALAFLKAVCAGGFAENKILEFIGPGVSNLSMDERNGIDVMTAECGSFSSVWTTDGQTEEYLRAHGREDAYRRLAPAEPAYYDGAVTVDLTRVEPMIALPFHPSNAYTIREFTERAGEILESVEREGKKRFGDGFTLGGKLRDGKVFADRGVIAGCAGGSYENSAAAAEMLRGKSVGEFALSVSPASVSIARSLAENGYSGALSDAGATVWTDGSCAAADTPRGALSLRHVAGDSACGGRDPSEGLYTVALMDARSIAATAANGGAITSALGAEEPKRLKKYRFFPAPYESRVFRGIGKADPSAELFRAPAIAPWPTQAPLGKHLLLKILSVSDAPVTTDEFVPAAGSRPFDPEALASLALCRSDPQYVAEARAVRAWEEERRRTGQFPATVAEEIGCIPAEGTSLGSAIVAAGVGGGSAREGAAFCQRVLGGAADLCRAYADGRYRSALIACGILPLLFQRGKFSAGDYVYLENVAEAVRGGETRMVAQIFSAGKRRDVILEFGELTQEERKILLAGGLINFYREN